MQSIPMTTIGQQALRKELDHLKKVRRHQIIEAIATARAHGDLSENAEYHAAKEQQAFNEGRIREIEDKLSRANIIEPANLHTDKIVFGAHVQFMDMDSNQETTYQIVGVDEADIKQHKISVTSPLARAMLGKEEGDVAVVHAPKGDRELEIISIKYC
ncbi:MAG: transcription elongation factor GreA [Mariprofundales bacterium]